MKTTVSSMEILRSPTTLKVAAAVIISITFFYLGKHWSDSPSITPNLIFFSAPSYSSPGGTVSLSPNANITFDATSVANILNTLSPPLPSPPTLTTFGVVDENGKMTSDFIVGEIDPGTALGESSINKSESKSITMNNTVALGHFQICPLSMKEFIPCLDNEEAIKALNSTERGEKFERHCPEKGKELDCLIPPPPNYKKPIPWPQSRDEVWYNNVPHSRLVEDKGGQNWMTKEKDKFKFPGGGTQFIHGADQYLNQMSQMVPEIAFGKHTRVVLDIGCGVASYGAYLASRDVLTMSVAPKDVHENQIQFALERGVPAVVAAFATRRLPFPSQAFELIHCSRCRINWTRDDGVLLLEANRMLRAGGYFAWAAQPVYKHEAVLEEQWNEMVNLTSRMCWELVKKEGYIAIWQKPFNNSCYLARKPNVLPPLCNEGDEPDNVWYVGLKPCITRIPENGYGGNVTNWPERLHAPPDRLQRDEFSSVSDIFKAETKYWEEVIGGYVRAWHWKEWNLRNVMDMKAGYGGFGAALVTHGLDAWVMNVVPVSGPNTLPVIYDRGLIGVAHDWCESFDTYPRTYDLLHAKGLFEVEKKRCNISRIMVEMDRILRPGGRAYIMDTVGLMDEMVGIAKAVGWFATVRDTEEGPYASLKVLTCDKPL